MRASMRLTFWPGGMCTPAVMGEPAADDNRVALVALQSAGPALRRVVEASGCLPPKPLAGMMLRLAPCDTRKLSLPVGSLW